MTIWVSFTHSPSGLLPLFCCPSGGMLYSSTVCRFFFSCRAGAALLIEEVWVTAHTPSLVLWPFPWASSAAIEFRRYSVPPITLAKLVPTDLLGQRVNPGWPSNASLVSNWTRVGVEANDASWRFEMA
jgi:hypothetical protein